MLLLSIVAKVPFKGRRYRKYEVAENDWFITTVYNTSDENIWFKLDCRRGKGMFVKPEESMSFFMKRNIRKVYVLSKPGQCFSLGLESGSDEPVTIKLGKEEYV